MQNLYTISIKGSKKFKKPQHIILALYLVLAASIASIGYLQAEAIENKSPDSNQKQGSNTNNPQAPKTVENTEETCACLKSVRKLEAIENEAIRLGISVSKAYRVNKNLRVSPELVTDVLRCKCARKEITNNVTLTKRVLIPQKSIPPPIPKLDKKAKSIVILSPQDDHSKCQIITDLNYTFVNQVSFKHMSIIYRNVAVQLKGDSVIIRTFNEREGTQGQILRCQRFQEHESYIFDTLTSLVWQRCSETRKKVGRNHCKSSQKPMKFGSAEKYCASLPLLDGQRWRLPKIDELYTLVNSEDKNLGNTKTYSDFFPNIQPEIYWGSTPYILDKAVYTIDFETGKKVAYDKTKDGYIHCVNPLAPKL